MIKLHVDEYYSIEDADNIIKQEFTHTYKNQNRQSFYDVICAFDIETTSFTDDVNEYTDDYLYNYIKGNTIKIYDVESIPLINEVTFSFTKGIMLDEFYDDLRSIYPEWFPECYDPTQQIDYIIQAIEDNRPCSDKNKHGVIYCWQFAINGKVIFGRFIEDFIALINKIKKFAGKNKVIIFVHNLAFEFQWIRKYLDWSKVFAIAPRKPIFARTDNIEFRCSYILTNYSLAKLGEQLRIYDIGKLDTLDYDVIRSPLTPMNADEIRYACYDVLVVSAYIQELLLTEKYLYHIPYTATGFCRRFTRNECLYRKGRERRSNTAYRALMDKLQITSVEEYNQLKRAFQGGFTHCSYLKSGKLIEYVDSIDFTSSYPYSLLSEKYPMSKAKKVKPKTTAEFEKYLKLYCCIFDVELYDVSSKYVMNDHYISVSKCWKKEKYVADNGRIESAKYLYTTVTNVDFDIIRKTYNVKKITIHNMRIYKKGYLPKELICSIIKLYKDKTELKGVVGKEQEYLNGKALLNSVFGMMVTDISKEVFMYDNEWSTKDQDVEKDIEKYNKSKKRFLYYPWGVFCTAYSRKNLVSGIIEFSKGNDYCYCDTDSLKVTNIEKHQHYIDSYNKGCKVKLMHMCKHHGIDYSELEPMTKKGIKKPIGIWDHETKDCKYRYFKSIGAKRYMSYQEQYDPDDPTIYKGYHLTVAGVNKFKALPYMVDTYGPDVFSKFEQSLFIPEEHTGKLTHCYIDHEDSGIITDEYGISYNYCTKSGIYLEKASYSFDISEDYINYLKGVFVTK